MTFDWRKWKLWQRDEGVWDAWSRGDTLMLKPENKLAISDDTCKEKQGCFTTCFRTFYRHLVGDACWGRVTCLRWCQSSYRHTHIHQVHQLWDAKKDTRKKRWNTKSKIWKSPSGPHLCAWVTLLCVHDWVSQKAIESESMKDLWRIMSFLSHL